MAEMWHYSPMSGDLPPARVQQRLLRRLAELIRRRGHQRFLHSPLLEPSREHFPDPWSPDVHGVRAMLQRLMSYAGLGTFPIQLGMTGTMNPVRLVQESGAGAIHEAAWFSGIDDEAARFGYDLAHVHDPDKMAGLLAHEVSHAYRCRHGLEVGSESVEEGLTDLTTVFLGFGILTTGNTGIAPVTLSSRRTARIEDEGYLGSLEMAYLLAAQVVARGVDHRPVAEKLGYSPRRYFLAACQAQRQRRAATLEQLGIPLAVAGSARLFNEGKTVSMVRVRSWWPFPRYRCSDSDCGAPLRPIDLVCGNCGGKVAGALGRLMGTGTGSPPPP